MSAIHLAYHRQLYAVPGSAIHTAGLSKFPVGFLYVTHLRTIKLGYHRLQILLYVTPVQSTHLDCQIPMDFH
jgi:hypothetical protein